MIVSEAIGHRFHAVLVENGLLRHGEADQVQQTLTKSLGIQLTVVDASHRFLDGLFEVEDPEMKRRIIGRIFIEVFQETAKKIEEAATRGGIDWLLQGTLYPDVVSTPEADFLFFGLLHEFQGISWISRHVARPDIRAQVGSSDS